MSWTCISPEGNIEDIKSDRRSAKGIEKYLISKKAVYIADRYLPILLIKGISIFSSQYNPSCCCGKGIPVKKLRIDYGGKDPLILMLEKDKNVTKAIDLLLKENPDITVEYPAHLSSK